jgi:hypothetical protein
VTAAATSAQALAKRVGVERALGAALSGAIVYVAAWVLSFIFVALALVAASDSSPDWSWAFEAPAQLVGLAVGGVFTLGVDMFGISANVSVLWLPLLITALIVVGTAVLAGRDERAHASASRGIRWVRSGITGLALAVLILLFALVLPIRYQLDDPSGDMAAFGVSSSTAGSSFSFTAFLGALLIATLVSQLARNRVSQAGSTQNAATRVVTPLRAALAAVRASAGVYVAIVSALLTIGILIYTATEAGAKALLTVFLWLPTAVVDGLGFVNLAPIGIGGSASSLPGLSNGDSNYWLATAAPGWATALVLLLNLVIIVAAGIVLAVRRPVSTLSTPARWAVAVGSFAALGVLITIIGGIGVWTSLDTGGASDTIDSLLGGTTSGMIESMASINATIGLPAWTFVIFAVLGALVEASATYLAPLLIPLLPASVVARVSRSAGVATPAAGAAVSTDGVPVGADGVPVASPVVAAEPMSPERKRKMLIILASVGGAIVLVVGSIVAVSIINSTVYSPKHQVEAYLDNVVAGNASEAISAADISASSSSRVLLTDDILQATEGGITGYTILDTAVSDDSATITVELDQDGEKAETYFTVSRTGNTMVVFDEWAIDTVDIGVVSLTLPEGLTELDVNGVAVSLDDVSADMGYIELPAFPGEYEIALAGQNEYLASEAQTVTVSASAASYSEPIRFELEPTEEFSAAVQTQIEDLLSSCAERKLIEADDCPIYTYAFGDVSDVSWTIDEQATFEIVDYGDGEWYVQTDDRGVATVTYTRSTSYSEPETVTNEVDFSTTGTVEMVDGEPVYTYGY